MPTYQYACKDCGHAFEQVQSFSEDSLTVCPQCEGRLRKVFNAVGVVFKGSGFYRNDSRDASSKGSSASTASSEKSSSAEKSESSASSGSSGSSEKSTSSEKSGSSSSTSTKKSESTSSGSTSAA